MLRRTGGIVAAAAALALPAPVAAQSATPDSTAYVLSPASRLDVNTGQAGLFGFAGHEHRIRARVFSGTLVHHPKRPAASHLQIVVFADSLEVLTPPDTEEIRKVTEAMRSDVLDVAHHAEIRFVSTTVAPLDSTGHHLRVRGRLTIVGVTRDVSVEMGVRMAADTLRATGSFTVRQTDFGIRPYRAGPAGTVRVADQLTFDLDVVAVRAALGPGETNGRR